MRSVQRSPEPDFWGDIWAARQVWKWRDLSSNERQSIRNALASLDFGRVCAYCQQPCQQPTSQRGTPNNRDDETIDHFRPRDIFCPLWLDWPNLIYACYRCNQAKGNKWPGGDNPSAPGYVSPNAVAGQRPAQEFFGFDFDTGEIKSAEPLDQVEKSIACQTIRDIDLNDRCLGGYDESNLLNLRTDQLHWLLKVLYDLEDLQQKADMLRSFMSPDMPFSSFISAYVHSRPELSQLVEEMPSC